jgi:hypothetical protein
LKDSLEFGHRVMGNRDKPGADRVESRVAGRAIRAGEEAAEDGERVRHDIEVDRSSIPSYGDRYRRGEAIATSFAE